MSGTLQPEDRISHYRIVGPLGAGGMGEVYAARDETLERSVALKVLPPDLVRNDERVRRFITEAKSASSLNHPNIVTIYEIGHEEVGGAAVHFISMELVSGETLGHEIHTARTDLRTLVGYLAQAAEGIAKAHAAGIVHRDLKPGNIMVTRDGFAKVLDFGLAKLTEKQEAPSDQSLTSAPTREAATGEGVILGTVGYMSPEQVQGKGVDHRSDVFSLGCILYEAAARRRPFRADTDVEVMHQILRDDPPPVEELNPEVPAELRRIIRRCLAKNADRRFHSMKDLAIELREAVEQWDRLPGSVTAAGSGASLSPAPATVPLGRKGLFWSAVVGAAVLGLGGLAFGLYAALSRAPRSPAGADPEELRTSVLMSRNDFGIETSMGGRKVSGGAVLSADGRYLAYTTLVEGRSSLNVRQVRTGSDVPILPPQPFPIRGISFSPDGDYLHYLNQDPDLPNYSALFRVPSLGGTPSKIFFDVDTAATFSPDGRQLCFRRGIVTAGQNALVIGDLATGDERELLRISRPDAFAGDPSWSPEGSRIAIGMTRLESGVRASVVTIDVATGQVAPLGSQSWTAIDSLGWAAGGEAVVVSAFVFGAQGSQIYRLDWPGGESVRLTNDLNGYTNLSVAASTNQVTAIRTTDVDNIWIASLDPGAEPVALTSSTSSATSPGMVRALPDGGIAFILPQGEGTVVARMNADGSDVRAVSPRGGYVYWFDAREASGVVFGRFEEGEEGVAGIWRVNPDGSDARRLTEGYGAFAEALSPSGETLTFRRWDDAQRLRVMPTAGGEPHLLSELTGNTSAIYAPDGRRLLMTRLEPAEGGLYPRRYVVPVEGGEPTGGFLLPPSALLIAWAPDGAAVTYVDRNSGWNVYRQPIAEGEPVPLTRFEEGQVADLRWSPDGRHLALLRTIGERSALWVLEASSGSTRRVAELDHGSTRPGVAWTADSQSLVFRHGTTSQDVVMFSGF